MYAKLVTLKAGYNFDKEKIRRHLIINQYYLISEIYIESCHTTVTLKNLGDFNSVFFEFYDENKEFLSKDPDHHKLNHLIIRNY